MRSHRWDRFERPRTRPEGVQHRPKPNFVILLGDRDLWGSDSTQTIQ